MDNQQINDQQTRKNEMKGRGLFYGIIAVATFIIMAVGATFAYFTATTSSSTSSVQTGSTTLQLKFISYGAGWMNKDLIPVKPVVAEYSFENQSDLTISNAENSANGLCKDDWGNSICSVYVFQVYNTANSPQTVSINLISENNGFSSLKAMVYELIAPKSGEQLTTYSATSVGDPTFRKGLDTERADDDTLIDVVDGNGTLMNEGTNIGGNEYTAVWANRGGLTKSMLYYCVPTGACKGDSAVHRPSIERSIARVVPEEGIPELSDRTALLAEDIEIAGAGDSNVEPIKTFAIVLYISDNDTDQTETDAAKEFYGQVVVGPGGGTGGVSGQIAATLQGNLNLQSEQIGSSESGNGVNEPGSGS